MKTMKIYGPPGTGKTTTLISTLGKLLDRGYHPSEIAFLSHTRAAVDEVKHRIAQQYGGSNSREDYRWFRTIHSCCCGALGIGYNEIIGKRDYEDFTNETGYDITGDTAMSDEFDEDKKPYDYVLTMLSVASHRKMDYRDLAPDYDLPPDWHEFVNEWEEYKKRKGKIDFTDMLEQAEGITLPVKVMLVDECQDLSDRQIDLVKSFAANCDYLYLAGDDDQAIYEFMGSSNYGFLEFPAEKEVILEESFRVSKDIGKVAEEMIRRNKKRQDKSVKWQDRSGSIEFFNLSMFDLPWREIAEQETFVLLRHNKYVWKLYNKIVDMGINVARNGKGLTNDETAELVEIFLRVKNGGTAKASELSKMLRRVGLTTWANNIKKADPKNPSRQFSAADIPVDIWDKPMVDVFETGTYWKDQNLYRLEDILKRSGIEVLGTKPNIDIMTYHKSKGMEADQVICATDCLKAVWDEQETNPETERRLCYVGMTRARHKVIIVSPKEKYYMRDLMEV